MSIKQNARQRGDTNSIYDASNCVEPLNNSRLLCSTIGVVAVVVVFANSIVNDRIGGPIDGYKQYKNGTTESPNTGSPDNMTNLTAYLKTEEEQHESHNKGVYCQWAPGNHTECMAELIPHVCDTMMNSSQGRLGARILAFGDSTMSWGHFMRFVWARLKMVTSQSTCQLHCERKDAARCDNRPFYGFEDNMTAWIREPQTGREGPIRNGLKNHGCSDCVSASESCVFL
jgi:hypothetical protein